MKDISTNAHRLLRLFDQVRDRRHGAAFQRLESLSLSFSHVRALHLLACERALAMKDLAERLQMTPPSVTALARRLEQTGLVERHGHSEDSRVTLLALTDEGRALLKDLYHAQLQRMERLLEALSPEEQDQFLGMLERAVQALETGARP